MPRSPARRLPPPLRAAARELPALLLCSAIAATIAARATAATGSGVDTYSFPAFDAATTDAFVVATNSSLLVPASLLFLAARLYPEFNRSEGFLLLSQTAAFWRARDGAGAGGGAPPPTADRREASFNTSFTLRGAAPVAFAVLVDRFPPFNAAIGLGLRGNADANDSGAAAAGNASSALAAVEVGAVRSYGPDTPNVGLNVTVTPAGAAPARAVWIEYDAAAHRLSVRVAGAGEARPPGALLDVPVNLVERGTTPTAFVGFFAATVSDILVSVSGWELMVDRFPRGGKKGPSWLVILLAVLGSVAAAAIIVSAVVWCFVSRRRKLNDTEPKI